MKRERDRLSASGRPDLAARVRAVSAESSSYGFDILSFEADGSQRRIEVKATAASPSDDAGFWLSEHERTVALGDASWDIVRVCDVESDPTFNDIGNIVRDGSDSWELQPSTWRVRRVDHLDGDS